MADAPEGFKLVKYPNTATGKDVDLFVCAKCRPQWDTFDREAAKAHTDEAIHYPELANR
jgi:hypothetical protein